MGSFLIQKTHLLHKGTFYQYVILKITSIT